MEALNTLGIPCYHGLTLIDRTAHSPTHCTLWCKALDAKFHGKGAPFTRRDWDELLGEYGAVCDVPAICFAEELVAAYPEAKVVLVEREMGAWEKSFDEGITKNVWNPSIAVVAALDWGFVGRMREVFVRWRTRWVGCVDEASMRARARDKYVEHYRMVEKMVPESRLLKLKLEDGIGWQPLCGFLGVEVPDAKFPRVNEREALKELVGRILRQGMMNFLGTLGKVGVVAAAVVAMLGAYVKWENR